MARPFVPAVRPSQALRRRPFRLSLRGSPGQHGALYVVDFGEISIAPEKGGIRVWENTGALWRIRRTSAVAGETPPPARVVPSYAIKLVAGVVTGVAAIITAVVRRRRRD